MPSTSKKAAKTTAKTTSNTAARTTTKTASKASASKAAASKLEATGAVKVAASGELVREPAESRTVAVSAGELGVSVARDVTRMMDDHRSVQAKSLRIGIQRLVRDGHISEQDARQLDVIVGQMLGSTRMSAMMRMRAVSSSMAAVVGGIVRGMIGGVVGGSLGAGIGAAIGVTAGAAMGFRNERVM